MKDILTPTAILRFTLAVILLMHSVPSLVTGDVNKFGQLYLDKIGFAPFGLVLAWGIKLSHVVSAVLLVLNRFINLASLATIVVLVTGIVLIHFQAGWFVVGGGRNGMEFNILLISVFAYLMVLTPRPFSLKN